MLSAEDVQAITKNIRTGGLLTPSPNLVADLIEALYLAAFPQRDTVIDECIKAVRFCDECDCPRLSIEAMEKLKTNR